MLKVSLSCLVVISSCLLSWRSVTWIERYITPPPESANLACLSIVWSFISILIVLWVVFSSLEKKGDGIHRLASVVRNFRIRLNCLKQALIDGKIEYGSDNHCQSIKKIELELPRHIRSYYRIIIRNFMIKSVGGIFCIIILFASIYVAACTAETYRTMHEVEPCSGFKNSSHLKGSVGNLAIEGLYFSTVTFTTLGYGDIHPLSSNYTRCFAVLEAITFVVFLSIGISFFLGTIEMRHILNLDDLKADLNRHFGIR